MNSLSSLVKKELKEIIRDPRLFLGMVLVPLLLFPVMGVVVGGITEQAQETFSEHTYIGYLNLDEGNLTETILSSASIQMIEEQLNVTLINLNEGGVSDRDGLIAFLDKNDTINAAIVFPGNFSESIYNGTPAKIELYLEYGSGATLANSANAQAFVSALNEYISNYIILSNAPNLDPNFAKNPIYPEISTMYKGKVLEGVTPDAVQGAVMMQIFTLPLAAFMLITIAIQFAATSVASEKEQKTLETLLTLPISRRTLIIGKLTGALLISILGAVGYMLGLQYYMESITQPYGGASTINLQELGLGIDTTGYFLLMISIVLSIFSTLAIVTILASLAEDVRSAQSLAGIIMIPVFIGGFVGIFAIIFSATGTSLLTDSLLYIPFTNPVIVAMYVIQKNYLPVILSLVVLLIEAALFIEIAARFYSSEKNTFNETNVRKKAKK